MILKRLVKKLDFFKRENGLIKDKKFRVYFIPV